MVIFKMADSDIILNKIFIVMLSKILSNSSENFRPYIFFILHFSIWRMYDAIINKKKLYSHELLFNITENLNS